MYVLLLKSHHQRLLDFNLLNNICTEMLFYHIGALFFCFLFLLFFNSLSLLGLGLGHYSLTIYSVLCGLLFSGGSGGVNNLIFGIWWHIEQLKVDFLSRESCDRVDDFCKTAIPH